MDSPQQDDATRQPLSVGELTARIKRTLEQGFSRIRVIGEVSRLVRQRSGHTYFTIKDADAALSAVIWRSTGMRLTAHPEEGQQYIFTGHISLYAPQGRYQLVVTRVEAAGGGALAAEFERRKRLFAERGWFDTEQKAPLPALPRHIGIVTSEQAAALQDVRKVLASRPAWLRLTLSSTPVQGAQAAGGIASAIRRLQAMPTPPDVILLVRGGGSPEDMWCFNEEAVVRAVFECTIPIISGIGHEIDFSLADFAADVRAATPSNAAEVACPGTDELRKRLPRLPLLKQLLRQLITHSEQRRRSQTDRLQHVWRTSQDQHHLHTERQTNRLHAAGRESIRTSRVRLHDARQRLGQLEPRLRLGRQRQRLNRQHHRLITCERQRLHSLDQHRRATYHRLTTAGSALLPAFHQQLTRPAQRLRALPEPYIDRLAGRLKHRTGRLSALDPYGVLARGYSLAMTERGRIISSAAALHTGDAMQVRFADGRVHTRVESTEPE